jgi:hypothetical protein
VIFHVVQLTFFSRYRDPQLANKTTYFPQCYSIRKQITVGTNDLGLIVLPACRRAVAGGPQKITIVCLRKLAMSEEDSGSQDFVRIPIFQRMLDNPFLLLFIGVVLPTVFYIIWGIMEIVTIPIAQ